MKHKEQLSFLVGLLVILTIACSSATPAAAPATAAPTVDHQATIDAAIAGTAQAQANMQATIDAAVAATALLALPTSTPGPVNEYVELSEEELAAMIDQAVNAAATATAQASQSATSAASDDAMTVEEAQSVEVSIQGADEAIAYAEELIAAYTEIYGELAAETMGTLIEVEQDLEAMATSMNEMTQTLLQIETYIAAGAQELNQAIDKLEQTAQQAAAQLDKAQMKAKEWAVQAQGESEQRTQAIQEMKPDNTPADLKATLQMAFDFVDQIRGALGDNKLSRDELNRIGQLGANLSAGFEKHGGPKFDGFSGKVKEITNQLARGKVPHAKRGLDDFERGLGARPAGRPGGGGGLRP